MPSRAAAERKREAEAAAKVVWVCLVLKPTFTAFKVPLSELQKEAWGRTVSAALSRKEPVHFLDGLHPAIFAFFALYLNHMPLVPFVDLSIWFTGYNAAMPISEYPSDSEMPNFAMSILSDPAFDRDPYKMRTARKLFYAYLMGEEMAAPHFQDAVMNAIVRFLRSDQAPMPVFVTHVYSRCRPERLVGFKKLLVDYYLWAMNIDSTRTPPLNAFPSAFALDVTTTRQNIQTEVIIDPKDSQVRTEPKDVLIDFLRLGHVLCHGRQGRLKCRYHQHSRMEMCFNLIVDDTPIPFKATPVPTMESG